MVRATETEASSICCEFDGNAFGKLPSDVGRAVVVIADVDGPSGMQLMRGQKRNGGGTIRRRCALMILVSNYPEAIFRRKDSETMVISIHVS